MKQVFAIVLTAALVLGLSSCNELVQPSTGGITISVPGEGSRGTGGDTMRVVLTRNGLPVAINGDSNIMDASAGTEVEIEGLPPGSNYELGVAIGYKRASGFFETVDWVQSRPFTVSAGSSTPLDLTMSATPFFDRVAERQLTWFITPTKYTYTSPNVNNGASNFLVGSVYVNSLTEGPRANTARTLWLNTAQGLSYFNGSAIVPVTTTGAPNGNVLFSRGFQIGTDNFMFWYGGGLNLGFGKGASTADPVSWTWRNLMDEVTDPKIRDALREVNTAILGDVAMAGSEYFAVTILGTFRFTTAKTAAGDDMFDSFTDFSKINDIIVTIPNSDGNIRKIATDGTTLWAAPRTGLYASSITGAWSFNSLVDRKQIRVIEAAPSGNRAAAIDAAGNLLILGPTSIQQVIPFQAGMPSGPWQMTWESATKLTISGSNGTVSITP